MKHPFTPEDIDYAASEIGVEEHVMQEAIKCLWSSALNRGAVRSCYGYSYTATNNRDNWVADTLITKENYENDGDIDFACAIIKLPGDKK